MLQRRFPDLFHGQLDQPAAVVSPTTFIVCPLVIMQNFNLAQLLCQFGVYQMAYEQAQAALRAPSHPHEWLAVWN